MLEATEDEPAQAPAAAAGSAAGAQPDAAEPAAASPEPPTAPQAADPAEEAAQAAAQAVEAAAAAVQAAEQLAAEAEDGEAAPAAEAVFAPPDRVASDGAGDEDAAEGQSNEPGQKGMLGRIKEKAATQAAAVQKKVQESERVQQSVQFVKKKTTELAESERGQKIQQVAKDTAKAVSEKTKQGLEIAKEKAKSARAGAGTVWEKGRGSIQKAKSNLGQMAWRGSARETLDMESRKEQWQNIKVQGAEELTVPARTEHTCAFHVSSGSTLRWTFRVKDYDIGFGVRVRIQEWGGSKEEEILATERYDNADTISGSWVADEDRTIVLAFDNRYSKLRSKTVAYYVGTEKPPACQAAPAAAPADASPAESAPEAAPAASDAAPTEAAAPEAAPAPAAE